MTSRWWWIAVGLVFVGCAATRPRLPELMRLDREMQGPVARHVQRYAPEAYAEFARAVRAAEEAAARSPEEAALRAAEAEVILQWAATQARGAQARARVAEADRRRREAEIDAARMEQQAAVINREVDDRLEAQRAVARARRMVSTPQAIPRAERLQAAAEVRQQAELVLAAAALLGAEETARARVAEAIRHAEEVARGNDGTAALVAAGRALVMAETLVRQTRTAHPGPEGGTDGVQLASELSDSGGFEPRRDERGVIAVMRGLFGPRNALTPSARGRIETMARLLQGHGDVRVRVEAYVGGPRQAVAERVALARARAVVDALVRAGVPASRLQAAGVYRMAGGARSEDVVEIVMVLPNEP